MSRFALVIGNSEYQDPKLARLVAPDSDVADLAEVLRSADIGGFDEVQMLVNRSAPDVRRGIARFFTDKKPDDLLLLYFSGHGVRDDRGALYLAVQDTEHDLLNATAIPADFVTDEMDRSRSRRQVLILDCCHSGAFSHGAKGATGEGVGTGTVFEGTGFGRMVLTATDATQFAWEGDRLIGEAENSVFTHYLIWGLRTGQADTDGDGRVTLDELYDYVYEQVVKATPKQTPRKFSYNQQGDVVIARNLQPVARPAELPADLRQAVESPYASVREGAVRELERLLHGHYRGLALAAVGALQGLAADDSRRVSQAARAALAAAGQASPMGPVTEPMRPPAAAPQAQPEAPLGAEPVVARPLAPDRIEREPLERQEPAPQHPGPQPVPAPLVQPPEPGRPTEAASEVAPAASATQRPDNKIWLGVALAAIGWLISARISALILEYYISDSGTLSGLQVGAGLNGCLLGLTMSLVAHLRWSLQRRRLLVFGAIWAVGWMASDYVYVLWRIQYGEPQTAGLIGNAITGVIGGAGSAIFLAWHFRRSVLTQPSFVILAGWIAAAIGTSLVVYWGIYPNSDIPEAVLGAVTVALIGAIGTGVMLRQFEPDLRAKGSEASAGSPLPPSASL